MKWFLLMLCLAACGPQPLPEDDTEAADAGAMPQNVDAGASHVGSNRNAAPDGGACDTRVLQCAHPDGG